MDSSLLIVLVMLGGIFAIIRLLVFIHDRDVKRDAKKNQ